jgi:serine/threonine protein kinase
LTRPNRRDGAVRNDEIPAVGASEFEATVGASGNESGYRAASPLVGVSGTVYRPLRELGEGGMARVYLAYAEGSQGVGKLVVLKVMRESHDDAAACEMFLEEARLSALLNHPNIVQVYEVVPTGDFPYMVMEYLEGKPLSKIRVGGLISQSMVMTILCEALLGLHHAHELRDYNGTPLNIVHRDVSPQNIFVTYDGVVKVLDFGIAKTDAAITHTEAGQIKGKLTYMAPEQLLGGRLDRRADIFAAGAMLWELAVGGRVWENVPQPNIIHRLATGDIPRPSARATVDPELEAIILTAMAPSPDLRYSTALEMQQALEAYRRRAFGASSTRTLGVALATTFEGERQENLSVIAQAMHESLPPPSPEIADVLASDSQPAEAPPPRSRLAWVIAGMIAALGGGLLWLRVARELPPKSAPSALGLASARLVIDASPPEASVVLDGDNRGTGHLVLSVPLDARDHKLRISSPGFVSLERSIRFDGNQDLTVRLEPIAKEPSESQSAEPGALEIGGNKRSPAGHAPIGDARITRPRAATEPRPQIVNPAPAAPAEASKNSCDPPYYFKGGIKTYKPDCL